ncbi:Conserved oligomeric Golgi complex subunit 4 [Halotydeus destructor]|nr:Conserved oligomeric Golgi complex subunit 4 [Halotydeus destructor]
MNLGQISTIEELEAAYEELRLKEAKLENEVSQLLSDDSLYETKIASLQKSLPNTNLLESDANQLMTMISFTATLAQNVSFKVKKLDMVKNRVAQCLQRVGDIADLRTCTEGIQEAMDNEDYEIAAQLVQRFLEFDKNDIQKAVIDGDDGKLGELTTTSLDDAFAKLEEAKKKLQEIVFKKFDEAVSQDDIASTERFFKLFPLLKQNEEGLKKFSTYLCTKISDASITGITSADAVTHAEKLGHLYQTVAKIVDIHQPMVETFYKPGNLISVIEHLQKECDIRAKRILDDFKTTKNFNNLITVVQKALKSTGWSSNPPARIDPRDIDILLTEITLVNSRSETYFNFVRQRVKDDINIAFPESALELLEDRKSQTNRLTNLLRHCELNRSMQDLSGKYVLLEEYFLFESCSKAILIDEANSEASITSFMLDDVFFILKNSVRRASSGGSLDVLCAIINHSVTVLDTLYYDALNERVRYGYPSDSTIATGLDLSQAYNAIQAGRYLQSSTEIERAKMLFVTALNNLDLSCEYLKTLKQTIKEEVKRTVILNDTKDQEKLDSCLQDLSALAGKFQSLVAFSVNQVSVATLKPKVKLWIEAFTSIDHDLSEDNLSEVEATEGLRSFTQNLIVAVDATLSALKNKLTEGNYDALVSTFAADLATRFENAVLKCTFNKLGGFQFDRELRAIVNYLTSATGWVIRDKFARLNQISLLLNMDSVSEVCEYFSSHHIAESHTLAALKLTPSDVRKFMRLRSDFDSTEIKKAVL